jgi:hypothetical protein
LGINVRQESLTATLYVPSLIDIKHPHQNLNDKYRFCKGIAIVNLSNQHETRLISTGLLNNFAAVYPRAITCDLFDTGR